MMYANGEGTAQNYSEALRLSRLGADQGSVEAQFNLGNMYANGQGTAKDPTEAVRWLRRAANQGFTEAQFNLGVMYRNGEGVPQDFVQAHIWFNLAAAQGRVKQAATARDQVALSDVSSANRRGATTSA